MTQLYPINIWADQRAIRMSYTGGGLLEYIGYALPRHQLRDTLCWGIIKLSYDGNNRQITQYYAQTAAGVNDHTQMNKTWADRATYTYT